MKMKFDRIAAAVNVLTAPEVVVIKLERNKEDPAKNFATLATSVENQKEVATLLKTLAAFIESELKAEEVRNIDKQKVNDADPRGL